MSERQWSRASIMQNLDMTSILFLLLGAVAAIAVIYYSFGIAREWFGQRIVPAKAPSAGDGARYVSRCAHRHPMD